MVSKNPGTKIGIQILWLVFAALLLVGCEDLPDVANLVNENSESPDLTPEAQSTAPVEVVLLEPTPTATPKSEQETSQLLFVSNRGALGTSDIYLVNADGSGLIRLTQNPADDYDPSWSPDRGQIAFTSDRTGTSQIYILTLVDMKVEQLTDHLAGAESPTWSPDGERIAFLEVNGDNIAIQVMVSSPGGEITKVPVNLDGMANLTWSPVGEAIAFSAYVDGAGEGERDVFSLDMNKNTLVNLTNSTGVDDNPAWSPSGERLTYQSDREGDENIYVMQTNGTLQTQLTDHPAANLEPDWSSDGHTIAFSSDRNGAFDIYLMSDSGSDQRALAPFDGDDRQPRWPLLQAPIVGELAVAAGVQTDRREILVISDTGGKKVQVLKSTDSDETMPNWSPDGKQIVFATNLNGNYDIYIINADSSVEPFQLTDHPGADMHPAWSPDGSQIAFEAKRDEGDWDIWVIDVDGSNQRNLTANSPANDGNPSWSPDGTQIVYSSNRENDFDIYVLDADGSGEPLQLTTLQGDEFHPDWSPDGGQIAFRAVSPLTGKHQVYIMGSDGSSPSPLFSNQANDDLPDWSDDGQRIAFASDRANPGSRTQPGKYDIYVYDLSTEEIIRVTQGDKDVRYPDWKPHKKPASP